jgi:hypothetical protein
MEKDREAFDAALAEHRDMLRERREEARQEEGDNYKPRWELRDDFRWMVFPDEVSFTGESFPEEGVDFFHTRFGDRTNFTEATFPTDTNFALSTFGNLTDFSDSSFASSVSFFKSSFGNDTHFYRVHFGDNTEFDECSFGHTAQFVDSSFGDSSSFNYTSFYKNSIVAHAPTFQKSRFGSSAEFIGALLGNSADFCETSFGDSAQFLSTSFGNSVSFLNAKFGDSADFADASFGESVGFVWTVFGDSPDFFRASFGDGASFKGVHFDTTVDFFDTLFTGSVEFIGVRSSFFFTREGKTSTEARFEGARFQSPEESFFRNADLTRTRLLNVDVRKIEFTNVIWPKIKGSKGVYDEIAARESGSDIPFGELARLYRRLKQNYEDNRDYGRGGDFHFREKEMMRLNPKTPLGQRVLLTLYRMTRGYGERYWAAGWFLGLVVVCSLVSLVLGIDYTASEEMQWTLRWRLDDFIRSIVYSVQTAFVRPPEYMVPANLWGEAVKVTTMILGPLFLGLFALAVRQRVRR